MTATLCEVTPSSTSIVATCIRASDPEGRASRATACASEGSTLHQLAEDAACQGWDAALAKVPPEHFERATGFDTDGLVRAVGAPLASFSWGVGVLYCPVTGEGFVLGQGLTRQRAHALAAARLPTLEGRWVVGLLDLCAHATVNGQPWVLVPDLKTGHQRPAPAASCWQTRIYAVALAAATGAQGARHGPLWMPSGEYPRWDKKDLDATGLFEAENAIRELYARIDEVAAFPPDKRPEPVYGEHCTYCRQALGCRAPATALARLNSEIVQPDGSLLVTKDNAAAVYHRMKAVQTMLDQAHAALVAVSNATGPIDLGNGRVFGAYPHSERETVEGRLYAPLAAKLGEDAARDLLLKATRHHVPVTALERAYLEVAIPDPAQRKGQGAKTRRELDELLRENGALVDAESVRVGAHYPKKGNDA